MVDKVTESFLNWGFNPSVSTQGFNNPPYVGALAKFWYVNDEGEEYSVYYVFNCNQIINAELSNKCKKLLEKIGEGIPGETWNKANYLITFIIALAICYEWGYDFDDIGGPLLNTEAHNSLGFNINHHVFAWRGVHPINTPLYNFLKNRVDMYDISEGIKYAMNFAQFEIGWTEADWEV